MLFLASLFFASAGLTGAHLLTGPQSHLVGVMAIVTVKYVGGYKESLVYCM